jgi:hypothetical protein
MFLRNDEEKSFMTSEPRDDGSGRVRRRPDEIIGRFCHRPELVAEFNLFKKSGKINENCCY